MKRVAIRRKPRKDAIPAALALAVFKRDDGCVAPRLGGSSMDCWGRWRIEHVKAEPRMGVRAEPQMNRLVTLCEGHSEPGMRAGYVWATDRLNRALIRTYLLGLYPEIPDPMQMPETAA